MCLRVVIRLRGAIRLRAMCLRHVCLGGYINLSAGGNSSPCNSSLECVFTGSFVCRPCGQFVCLQYVFGMCLREVIGLRGAIRLRALCLRNVSSRGNSSAGG